MSLEAKKRVCYFYDANVGNYHYGPGHPMRPHRIRMCHGLVMNYGLYKKMEIYRAKPANKWEMTQFHTDDYIDFLSRVTPENMEQYQKEQAKFNVGDDSPIFEGLFEYCGLSAGGSMEGAARLNRGLCDIAINWAGGLHHAKKAEASGFCYVNDIVLGILELLRYYSRVLYIDIDVHHGDGVEEAFYTTDRVMTVSFHKYGEFFPGTGELKDVGVGKGKYYSVNFPLRDGVDDDSYQSVFEPVIEKVMEWYRPSAVVLQCGGDSLSGDKLGCFNLSMKGHANCVRFVKKFNLPTLVLGGGGYTMRNVARAWAYETGVVVGQEVGPDMPYNDYYEYFGPDYKLDIRPSNMENLNTTEYLEKTKHKVFENLARTMFAPSVQMQEVPGDRDMSEDEDEQDQDNRYIQALWDRRVIPDNEFYDSDEGEAQGSGGNRKSRHYQNYGEEDSSVYDGDESDENRANGSEARPAKKAKSRAMEVDTEIVTKQEDVVVSRDEEMEIEEALKEEEIKVEPLDGPTESVSEVPKGESDEPQEKAEENVYEHPTEAMDLSELSLESTADNAKSSDPVSSPTLALEVSVPASSPALSVAPETMPAPAQTEEATSIISSLLENVPAASSDSPRDEPVKNAGDSEEEGEVTSCKSVSPIDTSAGATSEQERQMLVDMDRTKAQAEIISRADILSKSEEPKVASITVNEEEDALEDGEIADSPGGH
ncbi:hypothetical protein CLU79DRAFT_755321 [Phycomyces nitens]|nr:hypothetical protein CLU79DRAFT_755321 [Phycomyces nitens]